MNLLKNILTRPILVILILILFWSSFIFFNLNSSENFSRVSAIVSLLILLISLLFIGFQKKWVKLILSSLLYLISFAFIVLFLGLMMMTNYSPEIDSEVGDTEFYKKEIKKRTGIEVPQDFKLIAKIDTIRYMGMEGEYDAECLYYAPSNSITNFEKKIKSNSKFKKLEITEALNSGSDRLNFKDLDFKSFSKWYVYDENGSFTIKIAIKKDAIYYDAFYY